MKYDFAISYAGEDAEVARKISQRLQENSRDLDVFLAEENTELLIGVDGEQFFERLFTDAKQVIVVISKHYKHKQWTRLEWDIILDRAN
ncbi:MAG: toll/interleukin-1 receptor domain-containing protein, partial [Cyanobacteria bacterium P01_H01_bin.162]